MKAFTDVFVYTNPECPRCKVVKTKLNDAGISWHEITIDDKILEYLDEEGFATAPVLSVDGELMDFSGALKFIEEMNRL